MLLLLALALPGCRAGHIRDRDYADLLYGGPDAAFQPDPGRPAILPVAEMLEGAQPVEVYIRHALERNPDIQAARKRVDAMASRVPQAASLDDPMLSAMGQPFFPHVTQTAGGRMTVDMTVSQQVPWLGKLRTQAEAAVAEVQAARARLVAAELEVVEQVKRAYYELYFAQQALRITEADRELLLDLAKIAEVMYAAGNVSQQDVLRAQLELSNLDADLLRLRQQFESAQARLARLLRASPESDVRALDELLPEQIPQEVERLYDMAVAARPELHAQLAEIDRDRWQVELARLQYFPDFNFSFGWGQMTTDGALAPTADGIDSFSLGVMVNLPIYRQRLDARVREAEADAVANARRYDSLRDRTLEEVKDLFAQVESQREMVRLFERDILPRAELTLEVSVQAYRAGEVGFLQLFDNWRQLLSFQLAHQRLLAQLRQSLASLERIVGGRMQDGPPRDAEP